MNPYREDFRMLEKKISEQVIHGDGHLVVAHERLKAFVAGLSARSAGLYYKKQVVSLLVKAKQVRESESLLTFLETAVGIDDQWYSGMRALPGPEHGFKEGLEMSILISLVKQIWQILEDWGGSLGKKGLPQALQRYREDGKGNKALLDRLLCIFKEGKAVPTEKEASGPSRKRLRSA